MGLDDIKEMISDSIKTKERVFDIIYSIESASDMMIDCLRNKKKIMICGNGGSAAQAQHFAAELVGRFENERKAIPCISLTTDTSNLTALGNDYGVDVIFKRQVEALGSSGDVLICLTTSGTSQNLIEAIKMARDKTLAIKQTTVCLYYSSSEATSSGATSSTFL